MDEGGARREGSLLLVVEGVVDLVLQEASVGLHGLGGVFGQGASPGWKLWVQSLPVTTPSSRSFVREGHISKARILSEDLGEKGRRNE